MHHSGYWPSPARKRHRFEYFRHGTLSLYATLETRSGQVIGSTASRHTSQEFVRFLQEVVAAQSSGKEIHLIMDNRSAHKTRLVERFLTSTQTCRCMTRPLIVPGSTKSKTGSPKSSATRLPVESSHRWPTCAANSCATSSLQDCHSPSMDLQQPNQSNRSVAGSSDTLH